MTIGVYEIRNKATGARYIGASRDIEARWIGHVGELRRGKHINPGLQRDWDLRGEEWFEFTILEEVAEIEQLPEREQHHANQAAGRGLALYSRIERVGVGLLPAPTPPEQRTTRRTLTLSDHDMALLQRITQARHADDPRSLSLTVRELIREEGKRQGLIAEP